MKTDNYQIRLTWIDENIRGLKDQFDSEDEAFLHFSTSTLFDIDIDDIDPEDVIDGGGDKQIDIIRVTENSEEGFAEIDIIQVKNETGFSSNTLIKVNNGLKWIFEKRMAEVGKLNNTDLIDKIKEIRTLMSAHGQSNLNIKLFYISKADSKKLASEYVEERQSLLDKWSQVGFGKFEYKEIGAHELVEIIEERERSKKKVDVEFPIVYDTNRPSLMEYSTGDTQAVICTITGKSLAEIASTEPKDAIFDLNVRPFYGLKGKVNQDILKTCSGEESKQFWFLNNGITMVCEKYDIVKDPDNPKIKVKNAQIVNGCQTTVTVREAQNSSTLSLDVKLVLKIYATKNPDLVERITLTTNNQNKITDRDLRANDSVQRDMERIMQEKYGYYYERKNKQHRHLKGPQRKLIVPNSKAAQAYLAIVKNRPSNARGYLALIWSDFYDDIFSESSVGDLLGSFLILRFCQRKAKEAKKKKRPLSKREREVRVYGMFHLCRILGSLILKDKWGRKNMKIVDDFITSYESKSGELDDSYKEAARMLMGIRQEDKRDHPIPALYFKSGASQNRLMQKLSKKH